jgi:polyphosphate kinase
VGLSENIQVKSVVGRYLEHSRIFYFENDGDPAVFIGSGDWMERNLRERVEVSIPIKDAGFVRLIEEILTVYWADNVKSRWMRADGSYVRAARKAGETAINAQEWLAKRAETPDLPMPQVTPLFPPRPTPETEPE